MTPFEIERFASRARDRSAGRAADRAALELAGRLRHRQRRWPARASVYVGETVNAVARMRQHLEQPEQGGDSQTIRVVIDDTFNKSVCLDLESLPDPLARRRRAVQGPQPQRRHHRRRLLRPRPLPRDLPRHLRAAPRRRAVHAQHPRDREQRPLQAVAVQGADPRSGDRGRGHPRRAASTTSSIGASHRPRSIQGDPGTGKTIVAIFLMKLLADIRDHVLTDDVEPRLDLLRVLRPENRELLAGLRIGLVIPQQSLRESIQKVFKKTPKLHERHGADAVRGRGVRPSRSTCSSSTRRTGSTSAPTRRRACRTSSSARSTRSCSAPTTRRRPSSTGSMRAARHQILLIDGEQSVRPRTSPRAASPSWCRRRRWHRRYRLTTQMRVQAGADYVGFVRRLLRGELSPASVPTSATTTCASSTISATCARPSGTGTSAVWRDSSPATRGSGRAGTIRPHSTSSLDGVACAGTAPTRTGSTARLDRRGRLDHRAGLRPQLRRRHHRRRPSIRPGRGRLFVDRESYRDKKGKENNGSEGLHDDDLLTFIRNIYGVLLTRGIRGTYVYVCDPALRDYVASVLNVESAMASFRYSAARRSAVNDSRPLVQESLTRWIAASRSGNLPCRGRSCVRARTETPNRRSASTCRRLQRRRRRLGRICLPGRSVTLESSELRPCNHHLRIAPGSRSCIRYVAECRP